MSIKYYHTNDHVRKADPNNITSVSISITGMLPRDVYK